MVFVDLQHNGTMAGTVPILVRVNLKRAFASLKTLGLLRCEKLKNQSAI